MRQPKVIEETPPSPGLSRERIVDAALELIDRDGLDAFSVRGLAQHLSVYPTALYWYVPNRNALLALVVTGVLDDIIPPGEAAEWTEWLRALFRRYRAAIRRHPNVAPLIGAQLVSNTSIDFVMIERILHALDGAGFRGPALRHAYNTVVTAMVSFVTHEFAPQPSERRENWADELRKLIRNVDKERFPTLVRNLPQMENRSFIMRWQNGAEVPLDDSFEVFIDVVLMGLVQYNRQQAAS